MKVIDFNNYEILNLSHIFKEKYAAKSKNYAYAFSSWVSRDKNNTLINIYINFEIKEALQIHRILKDLQNNPKNKKIIKHCEKIVLVCKENLLKSKDFLDALKKDDKNNMYLKYLDDILDYLK